jgi:cellulose synthase/poly-beta-1,6-N-acetylglucosamine synthase-like glycosyltransferase
MQFVNDRAIVSSFLEKLYILHIPLLSLIIPAYNEASRLGHTLDQVLSYLQAQPYSSEVLLTDDGSNDLH